MHSNGCCIILTAGRQEESAGDGDEARRIAGRVCGAQRGAMAARAAPVLQADDQAPGEERGHRHVGAGTLSSSGCLMLLLLQAQVTNMRGEQPHAGKVEDQFPVIRVDDQLYTMSLRMMKAVW